MTNLKLHVLVCDELLIAMHPHFFVTQTLISLARDGGTVISLVHQPSSKVFELFDSLYLLSRGKTIYFGKASQACEVSSLFLSFNGWLLYLRILEILLSPGLDRW